MSRNLNYSVIIPVKNGERYIVEAIESVIKQTVRSATIYIVDNNSTDQTVERIQHSCLPVTLLHEKKIGAASARNRALSRVSSPIVAFLDADDICYPERLQRSLQVLEADSDAAMVFCAVEYIDENSLRSGTTVTCPEYQAPVFLGQLLIRNRIATTSCAVMRTEILKSVDGFDENLSYNEEYDLWLRIAERYKIAYIDQVLVGYRLHSECISRDQMGQQRNECLALQKYDFAVIRQALQKLYCDPLEAEIAYAGILFRRGNYQMSKELFFKLSDSGYQHYLIQFYLGNFQLMDGKLSLAASAYIDCLKLQADFLPAMNNLGVVEWGRGHSVSACRCFSTAIEKNGVYGDPKTNLEKIGQKMDYQDLKTTWMPLRRILKPC